jgi:nitroreductase
MVMTFRFRRVVLAALFLCLASISAATAAEVIKLPDPQTSGGPGVFDMLKSRASAPGSAFPTGKISREELSTLLWAATGLNRPDKGWTVPFGRGMEPYCRVYVTGEDGTFLYDWKTHSLTETSKEDGRSAIGAQAFVAAASHVLIIVSDRKAIEALGPRASDWDAIAAGAMSQNVYLAADALGIGTRYIVGFSADVARSICALDPADIPLCILPIGKR